MYIDTAGKVSKWRVFSGPNTGKYGPEKTPYFDAFHAVRDPSNTFKDENLSKVGVQQMLSKSSLVSETYQ